MRHVTVKMSIALSRTAQLRCCLLTARGMSIKHSTVTKTRSLEQTGNANEAPLIFHAKTNEFKELETVKHEKQGLTPSQDAEKFPTKLSENTDLLSKLKYMVGLVDKKKATASTLPVHVATDDSNNNQRVKFTDEEPIEMKPDMIKLDLSDPALWYSDEIEYRKLPEQYLMLSKSRLTLLVCITSAAGYGLASSAVMSFDPVILAVSTIGVGLTSAAANAINQFLEVPYDSQMSRTKNRVLVKGLLTPWHAVGFASVCGTTGALMLWHLVNPVASALAMTNLFLYTAVYTPMKRVSILNTWIGSVVGAIPPVIGWVSATGSLDVGALVLGGILYTWQFPHFNALSWNLRPDYSKAGYRMMSVTDPGLCKRVALRHSIGCTLVCSVAAPMLDVTSWAFAFDSLPLNACLIYLSWKFYENPSGSSSRRLFRYTLIHLPMLMLLMFISRKRPEKKT